MRRQRYRHMCAILAISSGCGLIASSALGGGGWVTYTNEASTRLVADVSVSTGDTQEKDYAFADLDHNGFIDLVVVRKQPFTTPGGRRNVLFMNENGVLVDRTATFAPAMLDTTNDRDVVLVDVNNDGWHDIVTAAACNGCSPGGTTDDSRLYINLGDDGGGNWLGYGAPTVLFGGGNNFCSVAAGDIDGDGYADLYFVSYNDSFEDQLLMNGGVANPGVFTNGNNRLTAAMLSSGFGTAAVIADMDNDGDNDIVKSQNGPVEIFRNNGSGVFDLLDPTYNGAAYHVGVGHLDGDGLLDLVISDDGTDRYILAPVLNGSPDSSFTFPGDTGGFGSDSYIVDLDLDGFNEVLIADADVDVNTCGAQTADILRNSPGPSFTSDLANIPPAMLSSVHDFAVFDVNNDTLPDIIVGACNGTQVWINSPPIAVAFSYPGGLPNFITPQETTEFDVQIDPVGDTIEPGTPALFVSTNGGAFVETALTLVAGNQYTGTIPAGECADRFDFYLSAQLSGGLIFFDPASAPGGTHTAFSAEGTTNLFTDTMEGDVSAWTVTNDASLTGGGWEAVDPNATIFGGDEAAPGNDATPDPNGVRAFVTENGPPNETNPGFWDVDGGPTTLTSPLFDLSGTDGIVSYARWAFSKVDSHDPLVIEISNDDGANWTLVDEVADTASSWQPASFIVSDYIAPTALVRVRFSISDLDLSVTEAGIDDFKIDTLSCGGGTPCPWDTDGDGTVGITDFLDLLSAWGPNPGHPADFDGDGTVGITDFLALLANWGDCP